MPRSQKTTKQRMAELDEQLARAQEKTRQIEERKKKLAKKVKEEARKARTKRLIEIGATVESVCDLPIEKKDLPKLLDYLHDQELRGYYFSKAMGYSHRTEQLEDGQQVIRYWEQEPDSDVTEQFGESLTK